MAGCVKSGEEIMIDCEKNPHHFAKKLHGVFVVTLCKLTLRAKEKEKAHVTAEWKKRGNTRITTMFFVAR